MSDDNKITPKKIFKAIVEGALEGKTPPKEPSTLANKIVESLLKVALKKKKDPTPDDKKTRSRKK